MRYLGVDYGHKRIGLAISDPSGLIAQPLHVVQVKELAEAADDIARLVAERDVCGIVIGLPRNMDGTLGPKAKEAQRFRKLLLEKTGLDVLEWDERLSTAFAQRTLRQTFLSRRKRDKRVDMVAAQIILQAYLDSLKRNAPPVAPDI